MINSFQTPCIVASLVKFYRKFNIFTVKYSMQNIKNNFKKFNILFPYLNIKEQIENFAVFDGFKLETIDIKENIFESIRVNIIDNHLRLRKYFKLYDDLKSQNDVNTILHKIALGDRKQYALYRTNKNISQNRGRAIYKKLYELEIIKKEATREKLPDKTIYKLLKKELRGYVAEDKIKFIKNIYRFWYTFISPFENELEKGIYKSTIGNLEKNFDKFVSLTFEELSNELLKDKRYGLSIIESGGYWDKTIELDLLARDINHKFIIGECKWTNQKICKNVLRKLEYKAKNLNYDIIKFALFSKNGFSNSLYKKDLENVMLFDIKDFKRLNDD